MRLHEFEAKTLFREYGIPVPRGAVAEGADEAARIAVELGGSTVVKAQVLAGGRGRAGGILTAAGPAQAGHCADAILASRIRGCQPASVLVEEGLKIARELYLGITVDSASGRPAVVCSAVGGVDIEEVAASRPEAIATLHPDPTTGLGPAQARSLVAGAGLAGEWRLLPPRAADVQRLDLEQAVRPHRALPPRHRRPAGRRPGGGRCRGGD